MYNGEKKPTKLTLEQWDLRVSLELPNSDTTLAELFELYKGISLGMGYSENSWERCILDAADELTDFSGEMTEEEIDAALAEHNADEEDMEKYLDNRL